MASSSSRVASRSSLDSERPVLLVFGGSRGARSINRALLNILPDLLDEGLQVIHVSGTLDWSEVEARRDELAHADYHAYPYLHHEMGQAQAAADLVLSRAGASTLAEFPYFGLASILVPYPHAWRTQKINADYLAARGAAIRLDDEALDQDLLATLRSVFEEPSRLAAMREASRGLAGRDGASRLAASLIQLAGGTQ
jgi:UDP-N-acetylglucosamine--N-acetylmuramyl-(pentapeptide) pyrophosphoryl-undecaprenol N-acetylglucosamine transferase